jgi:hypothetical protein
LFVAIFGVFLYFPLPVFECVEVCFDSLVLTFWWMVYLAMQPLGLIWLNSALHLPALGFPLFRGLI